MFIPEGGVVDALECRRGGVQGAVQVQCGLRPDKLQVCRLKVCCDCLDVELVGFEFFRPCYSSLPFLLQYIDSISGQRMSQKRISVKFNIPFAA